MPEPNVFILRLNTTVPAPRQRVYELLVDPDQIRRWFGPRGFTVAHVDMDHRVGGNYRYTMQPPEGDAFHLGGVFTEIAPPERLAFTFMYAEPDPDDVETLVTLTLHEAAAGETTVVLEQGAFATEARRALHEEGWSDSFERLAEVASEWP